MIVGGKMVSKKKSVYGANHYFTVNENGYANLKLAVQHGMNDFEKILHHDMLAYLRLQDPFERFQESGFTAYG